MSPRSARQPAKANKPRQPLTRERIVTAALTLVDRRGGELSMRALGKELGVDPMAVYRHFRDKNALLDALVETAAGGVCIPGPETGPPLQRLRQAMLDLRAVLLRHPGLARHGLAMMPRPGSQSLARLVQGLDLMAEVGLPEAEGARAYLILVRYVVGVTAAEERLRDDAQKQAQRQDQLQALDAGSAVSQDPRMTSLLAGLSAAGLNSQDEFEYGLDRMLDGLAQRTRSDPGS